MATIPCLLNTSAAAGWPNSLSQLAFPDEEHLARAPRDEGIGLRALMATALRDGDSAALDELLAIAKGTTIHNG
jgi:hypothetical protein